MAKFYATFDIADSGESIAENASIHAFDSREAAEAWLRDQYRNYDFEDEKLEIGPMDFSDCWIKSDRNPAVGDRMIAPFSRSQIWVRKPGEHPGNRREFWVTPRPEILVARLVPTNA